MTGAINRGEMPQGTPLPTQYKDALLRDLAARRDSLAAGH
jgi:hypothetical protein